jgi:hypothetical protein
MLPALPFAFALALALRLRLALNKQWAGAPLSPARLSSRPAVLSQRVMEGGRAL